MSALDYIAEERLAQTRPGALLDYRTGGYLREATAAETVESEDQAHRDGGAGIIMVDGRRCFVAWGRS